MKRRDLILTILAAVIFAVAGTLAYGQLGGKKSGSTSVVVEVIDPIPADFDQGALQQLDDQSQTRNFTPGFDLNNGLNNSKPFNPL